MCECVWNAMALCICPVLYVTVASLIFCLLLGKVSKHKKTMLLGKLTLFHMFALREKLNVQSFALADMLVGDNMPLYSARTPQLFIHLFKVQ